MSLKNNILCELLKNDDYISGEELAEKFEKSRAAVWKAIKALQNEGCIINAVTNKGYILCSEGKLLNEATIKARLNSPLTVIFYDETDSTNNQAKRLINEGKNENLLVCAGRQTAGRGRQGKSFYSPEGSGIYMSLVIHPGSSLQNAVTATTAAAVAVCRAIEALTDITPQIKWVNDVYVNGRKICGILTEAVTDFESGTVSSVIIGIGVNITTKDFPSDVENAGALNADISRSALIAKIADELMKTALGDYNAFIDYYRTHSMIIGREITFFENGTATSATALEIDETGGLVVKTDNGEIRTLRSGEITVRRK